MKEIVFSTAKLEISPNKSFILRFPEFTLSLMFNKKKVFAEIIQKKARTVFEGKVEKNEKKFENAVEKLMKNLEKIIEIK